MDKLCNSVDGSSIVLQRDFSENATLGSQNEIQSAHWNQRHATLFTAHAWVTDVGPTLAILFGKHRSNRWLNIDPSLAE